MPNYKIPMFKNVGINVLEKTKAFVTGAGKIILALSVILWYLGSHGLSDDFNNAEQIITQQNQNKTITTEEFEDQVNSFKLENSYIGYMGKAIEP